MSGARQAIGDLASRLSGIALIAAGQPAALVDATRTVRGDAGFRHRVVLSQRRGMIAPSAAAASVRRSCPDSQPRTVGTER
jgi:hypothetical protein